MNRITISRFLQSLLVIAFLGCMTSCNESNGGGKQDRPDVPLSLSSFHPNYGKYLEKVILTGKGFQDPSQMRVYFNQREAAVIGVNTEGTELYVQAPRLPGEDCVITVVSPKDSLAYDEHFAYTVSTTVSTICGNGVRTYLEGSLSEAQTGPYYVCVDDNDNIFVVDRGGSNGDGGDNAIARIDLENDEMVTITTGITGNVPCVDPNTQKVVFPTETTVGQFIELDPKEMWGPRVRDFDSKCDWNSSSLPRPANGYKHTMVVNPDDGYIYTRYYYGQLVKIDPVTFEATVIADTPQGDSFGLTFRPGEPNMLYVSCWSNFADMPNSIAKIDVSADEPELIRLTSGIGGHRDGKINEARFNEPAMLFSDADGNIYVADWSNHCIRRITPENMVETVLGVPGKSGWKDGSKEEALFKNPRGIGISKDGSVYVADFGNGRIRKLSIN